METKGTRLIRRNSIWYVVWTGNSRGRSTGTGDRKEAERVMAAFIQEVDQPGQVAGGYTVEQAIEDYLCEHIRPNAASKETPELIANRFIEYFPAGTHIRDLGEQDILSYRQARNRADGTILRELGFLSAAFHHAAKKKRVSRDDLPYIPMPQKPPPRERWLTIAEETQLVAACPVEDVDNRLTRIWRFLILALETAGRKEALETLTWFQIDFGTGTINLNPPGRAQTNKRRAVVRMSTRLRTMLERAYQEKTTGFVLDHPGSIRASFRTIVDRSGLDDVSPHVLRHTWATRAAQAGVPMREVADWLGDSIQTVERNYYKRSPHYLKDATDWREREADRANIVPTRRVAEDQK
jgi:integrase